MTAKAKTAANGTENPAAAAAAAFDPNQVADNFRSFAEKGIDQSRENYTRMRGLAEEATRTLETTFEKAQAGGREFGLKSVDALRANADNGFSHVENLFKVKTVAEMIELQTAFLRKQSELFADQAKEMQALAQKVGQDIAKPSKAAFEKTVKTFDR